MHDEHNLLKVIDGCKGTCATDTSAAMEHNLVVNGDIRHLFDV